MVKVKGESTWQGPDGPFGWTEATLPMVNCNQGEVFAE